MSNNIPAKLNQLFGNKIAFPPGYQTLLTLLIKITE